MLNLSLVLSGTIRLFLSLIVIFVSFDLLHSADINIPSDYPDFQSALTAAENGDTIIVSDGFYSGPENVNLTIEKAVSIISVNGPYNCVLNGNFETRIFRITSPVFIQGFTFKNGYYSAGYGGGGGAIAGNSELMIHNCIFYNNHVFITDYDDHASARGGAVDSAGQIINSVFYDNLCESELEDHSMGGAVFDGISIIHCTFYGNMAERGSAIDANQPSLITMLNSIVWGNTGAIHQVAIEQTVSYCDIEGGYPGDGNIDIDPDFLTLYPYNFHITDTSPCVNTGAPAALSIDLDGNPRPYEDLYDIGADEIAPGYQTPTPAQTYTPWPTFTPTPIPTSTPEPTSSPSPTRTPSNTLSYELMMRDVDLEEGDLFDLSVLRNYDGSGFTANEFVLLIYHGVLFFWPSWSTTIDGSYNVEIPSGESSLSILEFEWPRISGNESGIQFWAVIFDAEYENMMGFDRVVWGYR